MPFPLVWLIPPVVGAIATKAAEKVLNPPPPPPPPPSENSKKSNVVHELRGS